MTDFTKQVPSGKVASVRIIDSTTSIKGLPTKYLMKPDLHGFDIMPELPTWSFLIENDSGRKVLFDLGVPADWPDMPPHLSKSLKERGWGINVDKPTVALLKEQNIEAESIEAIFWSHWHWDHIGNPSQFPPSTKLVVGPGFQQDPKLWPPYPANSESSVRAVDFEGRELKEISFEESESLQIGQFRAYDWFGDGSFYLLDTPGHATGHLAGLARTTTNPDTFICMGGDATHHSGEHRPSQYLPLPSSIPANNLSELVTKLGYSTACPGAIFEEIQTSRDRKPAKTEPFFDPAMGKDIPTAIETIKKLQVADGDDNVLYIFAHDGKVRGVADLFPAKANDWKQKGWREQLLWRFLEDFETAAVQAKGVLDNQKAGKL